MFKFECLIDTKLNYFLLSAFLNLTTRTDKRIRALIASFPDEKGCYKLLVREMLYLHIFKHFRSKSTNFVYLWKNWYTINISMCETCVEIKIQFWCPPSTPG